MQVRVLSQVIVLLRWAELQALPQRVGKLVGGRVVLEGLRLPSWEVEEASKGRFLVRLSGSELLLRVPLLIVLVNHLLHVLLLHFLLAASRAQLDVPQKLCLHLGLLLGQCPLNSSPVQLGLLLDLPVDLRWGA